MENFCLFLALCLLYCYLIFLALQTLYMLSALQAVAIPLQCMQYQLYQAPPITTALRRKFLVVDPLTNETKKMYRWGVFQSFLLTTPAIQFLTQEVLDKTGTLAELISYFAQKYVTIFLYVFIPVVTAMQRPISANPLDLYDLITFVTLLGPLLVQNYFETTWMLYNPSFRWHLLISTYQSIQTTGASTIQLIFGILRPLPFTGLGSSFVGLAWKHINFLLASLLVIIPVVIVALTKNYFHFVNKVDNPVVFCFTIPYIFFLQALPVELQFRSTLQNMICCSADHAIHISAFFTEQIVDQSLSEDSITGQGYTSPRDSNKQHYKFQPLTEKPYTLNGHNFLDSHEQSTPLFTPNMPHYGTNVPMKVVKEHKNSLQEPLLLNNSSSEPSSDSMYEPPLLPIQELQRYDGGEDGSTMYIAPLEKTAVPEHRVIPVEMSSETLVGTTYQSQQQTDITPQLGPGFVRPLTLEARLLDPATIREKLRLEQNSPKWTSRPVAHAPFDILHNKSTFSYFLSRQFLPIGPWWLLRAIDWVALIITSMMYSAYVLAYVLKSKPADSDVSLVFLGQFLAGMAAGYSWRCTTQIWVSATYTFVQLLVAQCFLALGGK